MRHLELHEWDMKPKDEKFDRPLSRTLTGSAGPSSN